MIDASQPTTLHGIKALAKDIKKAEGLQHVRALDKAAIRAGYQNFNHARNRLAGFKPTQTTPTPEAAVTAVFPVWVTAAWRDGADGGRETCLVALTRPLSEIVSRQQMAVSHSLGAMVLPAPDHLVSAQRAQTQAGARWEAARAARTLQFMDATGLKPTASRNRIYPQGQYANAAPASDHGVGWYDPTTRTYLYTDEPYNGSVERVAEARAAWGDRFGWSLVKPRWRGMHRPELAELFVMAPAGFDLQRIREALDALPIWPLTWPGLSRSFGDGFKTPGELAAEP